jgi:Fanconi anemia group M protein
MKEIFNIFDKNEEREKPKEKIKIEIDYREKNSLVASELVHLGFEIEFKELKVADYIVKETAIERKTVNDFISSMTNKRLFKQLEELQQYESKLLIVEGVEEFELYDDKREWGIPSNAIRGLLLSILLRYKVPIIFSKNEEDTAKFIYVLSRKKEKDSSEQSFKAKKKSFNKKEQMQYILEGFPGIGPKTAKKLLEEYGSINNILNAKMEDLEKTIGKKADIFKIANEKY